MEKSALTNSKKKKKKMEFGAKALINLSTHLFMQYS